MWVDELDFSQNLESSEFNEWKINDLQQAIEKVEKLYSRLDRILENRNKYKVKKQSCLVVVKKVFLLIFWIKKAEKILLEMLPKIAVYCEDLSKWFSYFFENKLSDFKVEDFFLFMENNKNLDKKVRLLILSFVLWKNLVPENRLGEMEEKYFNF
jgi:hypothetical protein